MPQTVTKQKVMKVNGDGCKNNLRQKQNGQFSTLQDTKQWDVSRI